MEQDNKNNQLEDDFAEEIAWYQAAENAKRAEEDVRREAQIHNDRDKTDIQELLILYYDQEKAACSKVLLQIRCTLIALNKECKDTFMVALYYIKAQLGDVHFVTNLMNDFSDTLKNNASEDIYSLEAQHIVKRYEHLKYEYQLPSKEMPLTLLLRNISKIIHALLEDVMISRSLKALSTINLPNL